MSARLQVQWPNASHPLLGNPAVVVTVDGATVGATSQQPGKWLFEIPEGASHLRLEVTFSPTLSIAIGGDAPTTLPFTVLRADQAYNVDGTTLQPDPTPFHLVNGDVVSQNVHPLIDTVSTGNAAAGLTIAEIRTEFVDVTDIWYLVANQSDAAVYLADCEPEIALVAIAPTQGGPPLWFATVPVGLEPPSPEVSTLVFFRPTLQYNYSTAWDKRHGGGYGQYNLNRYLLAPRDPSSPLFMGGESTERPSNHYWYITDFYPLRVGMQQAQIKSGKPLVVLHPWPTGGEHFGDAESTKLPQAAAGILRLLRGLGYAGATQPYLTLGRLGLAGYSAGGPATIRALRNNRHVVRELYLFDPNKLAAGAPYVIQWARQTQDFRLRMTGAGNWSAMMAIAQSVRQSVSGEAGDLFISAHPESPTFWRLEKPGGNPYWKFVSQLHPEYESDFNVHHQFIVFGGDTITTDGGERMQDNVTWFEEFLKGSAF